MTIEVRAWSGLTLDAPLAGGHRNEVWLGWWRDQQVAVRLSRRTAPSLKWELDLLERLATKGFWVPRPIATDDGELAHDGVVVQEWLDGRQPESIDDWLLVAAELCRLHQVLVGYEQRPGCQTVFELDRTGRSVDADMAAVPDDVAAELLGVFAAYRTAMVSVIHGDPGAGNIRLTADRRVGLLDWDESRVDVVDLDLANLGITNGAGDGIVRVLDEARHRRAVELADAWEVANAWVTEPHYAQSRLARLRVRRG